MFVFVQVGKCLEDLIGAGSKDLPYLSLDEELDKENLVQQEINKLKEKLDVEKLDQQEINKMKIEIDEKELFQQNIKKENLEDPSWELFIWSIIQNNKNLALVFWEQTRV